MWTRFFQKPVENIASTFQPILKPIAKAVRVIFGFEWTDFKDSIVHAFDAVAFLQRSDKTRELMTQSSIINMEICVNTFMINRAINLMTDRTPDWVHPFIVMMQGVLLSTILLRHFIRLTRRNLFLNINLPRIITKANRDFLPQLLAENLSIILNEIFAKIFFENSTNVSSRLRMDLHALFITFFKKDNITAESFSTLQKPLAKLFLAIVEIDSIFDRDSTGRLCQHFATIICEFLANVFDHNREKAIQKNIKEIHAILSKDIFAQRSALELTKKIESGLKAVCDLATPLLPIDYIKSCEDGFNKKIEGAAGSVVYAIGNMAFSFTPDLINSIIVMQPKALFILRAFVLFLLFLYKGESFNELRIEACTYHRARFLSANRSHSLGLSVVCVGLQMMLAEFIRLFADNWGDSLYQPTAVDQFFINNALINIVATFMSISILGYNRPLSRDPSNQLDLFFIPRAQTDYILSWTKWFFIPHEPEPRKVAFQKLMKKMKSPYLQGTVEWLLMENTLYPQKLLKVFRGEKMDGDFLKIIFDCDQAKDFLRLYAKDIRSVVPILDQIRKVSKGLGGNFLISRGQAFLSSMIIIPVLFFQDEAFKTLILFLKEELSELEKSNQVTIIEEDEAEEYKQVSSEEVEPHSVLSLADPPPGKLVVALQDDIEEEIESDKESKEHSPKEEKDSEDDEEFVVVKSVQSPSAPTPESWSLLKYGQGVRHAMWRQGTALVRTLTAPPPPSEPQAIQLKTL